MGKMPHGTLWAKFVDALSAQPNHILQPQRTDLDRRPYIWIEPQVGMLLQVDSFRENRFPSLEEEG